MDRPSGSTKGPSSPLLSRRGRPIAVQSRTIAVGVVVTGTIALAAAVDQLMSGRSAALIIVIAASLWLALAGRWFLAQRRRNVEQAQAGNATPSANKAARPD